jgi:hypothetical protein
LTSYYKQPINTFNTFNTFYTLLQTTNHCQGNNHQDAEPLDNLGYLIDETTWNKSIDPLKEENQKTEILNGYITQAMQFWTNQRFKDIALWEDFRDDFNEWTFDIFKIVSRGALKALRVYLTTHGVWIRKTSGTSFAKVLQDCLDEETRYERTKEEIEEHLELHSGDFNSRWNPTNGRPRTPSQTLSTLSQTPMQQHQQLQPAL